MSIKIGCDSNLRVLSSENLQGPSSSASNIVLSFDKSRPLSQRNSADADDSVDNDLRSKLCSVLIL